MELFQLNDRFAVCRLAPDDALPSWARGSFISVTRTDEELSLVCEEACCPKTDHFMKIERGWVGFKVKGPLEFSDIGILAALARVLAEKHISIFVVSTFDTDYIFVKAIQRLAAIAALEEAGHSMLGGQDG